MRKQNKIIMLLIIFLSGLVFGVNKNLITEAEAIKYFKQRNEKMITDIGDSLEFDFIDNMTELDQKNILALKNLHSLMLSPKNGLSKISDNYFNELSEKLTNLVALGLRNTTVGDSAFKYIEKMKKLEQLYISRLNLSDEAFKYIGRLKKLKTLSARNLKITDKALKYIKDLNLNRLYLGGRQLKITDKGMKYLSNMTNLISLDISYSQVSDKGLEQIYVKKLRGITIVHCTNITEKGLMYLIENNLTRNDKYPGPQITIQDDGDFEQYPMDVVHRIREFVPIGGLLPYEEDMYDE